MTEKQAPVLLICFILIWGGFALDLIIWKIKRSKAMTSISKKKKCKRTYLDRGGEKGHLFKMKRDAMYHKKDRVANKNSCKEQE